MIETKTLLLRRQPWKQFRLLVRMCLSVHHVCALCSNGRKYCHKSCMVRLLFCSRQRQTC